MKIAGKNFRAYGIGSYFKIPEQVHYCFLFFSSSDQQDMQKFEVLSRGSLILVPSKKRHFRIVSAAHIPFPFYYPNLYVLLVLFQSKF